MTESPVRWSQHYDLVDPASIDIHESKDMLSQFESPSFNFGVKSSEFLANVQCDGSLLSIETHWFPYGSISITSDAQAEALSCQGQQAAAPQNRGPWSQTASARHS